MQEWRGFENFVVKFLIRMCQDFASRSLVIRDESISKEGFANLEIDEKRSWEKSPHPYIFFNPDDTLSFCGFVFDKQSGSIKDETTGETIESGIINRLLLSNLEAQFATDKEVRFNVSLNALTHNEKLTILCRVFGVEKPPTGFEKE